MKLDKLIDPILARASPKDLARLELVMDILAKADDLGCEMHPEKLHRYAHVAAREIINDLTDE